MVGCRTGAANRLTKNYLWFAEKRGVRIIAEQEVVDVAPFGAADGSGGYRIVAARRAPGNHGKQSTFSARGVVFAGGTVATNELLADCKQRGSLPGISNRLGDLVRTNSETVLGVVFPKDIETVLGVVFPKDIETWRDVTASSRLLLDGDTQVELLTSGPHADSQLALFTMLTGKGSVPVRLAKWLSNVMSSPRDWRMTLQRSGSSARTLQMLVMQPRDNAIRFRAKKRRSGGYRLVTQTDPERPAPTYLEVGHRAASRVAEMTGGVALSSVFEAFGDIPQTAHMLGGAAIGSDAGSGVIERGLLVELLDRISTGGHRPVDEAGPACDAVRHPGKPGAPTETPVP
ncbi:hypothetical protein [Streptomyces sp. NPDC048521]|uniref:hypothetical protein n=1 Tax=Streptomyces sp. NPDC048521 TaxID=3365566 RepID=UPI00371AD750